MYNAVAIRRFGRNQDEKDWAELANVTQAEFCRLMQDPKEDEEDHVSFRSYY